MNALSQNRLTGTITYLNDKAYGFIKPSKPIKGNKGIFFHYKDLIGTTFNDLAISTQVEYTVIEGAKGYQAKSILVMEDVGTDYEHSI